MCGGSLSSRYRVLLRVLVQEARESNTQSAGIQVSAGQAATGAVGSAAVEEGSAGTAGYAGASGGREAAGDKAGAGRLALGTSKIKIFMVLDQADDT